MRILYLDEVGDTATYVPGTSGTTAVFVLAGFSAPERELEQLFYDFLELKKRFEPALRRPDSRLSDIIRFEIKAKNLRADVKSDSRRQRRRAEQIIDQTLTMLARRGAHVYARAIVKQPHVERNSLNAYSSAVTDLASHFSAARGRCGERGLIILDSRTATKNSPIVANAVTRRFSPKGPELRHLIEMPVFGHSSSLLPLQIADLVAGAIIYPLLESRWIAPQTGYDDLAEVLVPRVQGLAEIYFLDQGYQRTSLKLIDQISEQWHPIFAGSLVRDLARDSKVRIPR